MDPAARQDLAIIRQLMEETRREVVDRGKHLMLWGGLSTVGLLATYGSAVGRTELSPAVIWGVLLVLGWAASLYVGWRDGRGAAVRTLGRRLLTVVWVASAVTLTLVAAAGLYGGVLPARALAGVLSAMMAVPVLVTGWLMGATWLRWVAAGWWVGGGVMLFVPGIYALPLMAGMSLVLLAIPGGVLNARASGGRGSSPAAHEGA